MNSPEAQAVVNAACDQVQCVILDQMIQEEEKNSLKIKNVIRLSRYNDRDIDSTSRHLKNLRNLPWLNFSKN